jgi:GT2 family glycosyltransferase
MLNDDMKLDANVLNELIPLIERDELIFAVTCRIMDFEGTYTASAVRTVKYTKGWISNMYLDPSNLETKYTLYPGGGAAIFRTTYFNSLNGFDTLYRPAYAEDLDLGTRAWQRNWKTIYNPSAILYHREGGTINDQFRKDKLEQTISRNHILWMVKNGRYPRFIFWFFLKLPYRMFYNFFYNKNQFMAILLAFRRFKAAFQGRREAEILVGNQEWINLLNQPYQRQMN